MAYKSFDMGVLFTCSHNPPEYAGAKMVNHESLLIESTFLQNLITEYETQPETYDQADFQRLVDKAM